MDVHHVADGGTGMSIARARLFTNTEDLQPNGLSYGTEVDGGMEGTKGGREGWKEGRDGRRTNPRLLHDRSF